MADLPRKVVAEDRRLEKEATKVSSALAELRWHWTLDESNVKRVSVSAYARSVSRARQTIGEYANGYAEAKRRNIPVIEAMKRARVSAERETATEAVAEARGITFGTAQQKRPTEVRRVLNKARDTVERKGGTIEEAAKEAADFLVRGEEVDKRLEADRRERLGFRYVELEGYLDGARRKLEQALSLAREVEWEDEHQELLRHTLGQVKAMLGLIDIALAGTPEIDWDAELATIRLSGSEEG